MVRRVTESEVLGFLWDSWSTYFVGLDGLFLPPTFAVLLINKVEEESRLCAKEEYKNAMYGEFLLLIDPEPRKEWQ